MASQPATPSGQTLRFKGPPAALTAVSMDGIAGADDVRITIALPDAEAGELDASLGFDTDPRILMLALPDATPPGSYAGIVHAGDLEITAEIEVEPEPGLRVVPERLYIEAEPGATLETELVILNTGNTTVHVRDVQVAGLFLEGGVERAIREAYVNPLEEGQRRVDVLADALAECHGGLFKMKFAGEARALQPGDVGAFTVTATVPRGLESGHAYAGNWALDSLVYPVRVVVPARAPVA